MSENQESVFGALPQNPNTEGLSTTTDQRAMTFGEKLVGLTFNPSNDDKVAKAKALCAELADLVFNEFANREVTQLYPLLKDHVYCSILDAQMNVVKILTLKY